MTEASFPGERSLFHGFTQFDFELNGRGCRVVVPKNKADGSPWLFRAQFWGHEPQVDIALLERGFHLAYAVVGNSFGSPTALEHWDDLYNYLRFEHLLSDRVVIEGMSRGGLISFRWASRHPDKVACIYVDNPVCDFKSWPAGRGKGVGSPKDWELLLECYGLNEDEALSYRENPIDVLDPIAKAKIPLFFVVGTSDEVVPVPENTDIVEKKYRSMGGQVTVIRKEGLGHHPHCLEDPSPIVEFIEKNVFLEREKTPDELLTGRNFVMRGTLQNSYSTFRKLKRGHVAFLGGSITEMDGYRPKVSSWLEETFPETEFLFTPAGISSTCSDTGAFRLKTDVLDHGPLDLLFVEFAVNDDQDGIYSYNDALRGMEGVIAQARQHNPCVDIVITHFVNENILEKLSCGEETDSISAHTKIAEHYNISVSHLAKEVCELIDKGDLNWELFGGVHPNDFGNGIAAGLITRSLGETWKKTDVETCSAKPHPQVPLLDPFSYNDGRFLSFDDIQADENWKIGVPDWPTENEGHVRPRFLNEPMVYSKTVGAKLTIPFHGRAIGAYMLSGPDTGLIRCTLDGKESRILDTLHIHSGFNYPMTLMFFNELNPDEHILEIEILDNALGRIKEGGTAFRALHFVAN